MRSVMAMAENPHTHCGPEHSTSYQPDSTADTPLASGKRKNSGRFCGQDHMGAGGRQGETVSLSFMLMLISYKYNHAIKLYSNLPPGGDSGPDLMLIVPSDLVAQDKKTLAFVRASAPSTWLKMSNGSFRKTSY